MKKLLVFILIFASLLLFAQAALAFETNAIVNLEAPYATIFSGTFDNLIMDFSLITTSPDVVKAIGLKNLGSATYLSHIKYMKLWVDDGPTGWQGMGVDREVGNFDYTTTYRSWYIANLSENIADDKRFFVSMEAFTGFSRTGTIQMQIPILTDNNANGSFDVSDLGIFMDSGNNGPTNNNVTNNNSQVISTSGVDSLGPKLVMTNLFDGDILNTDNFMIEGMVRDQGNTYIQDFKINIDGQVFNVQELDVAFSSWRYDWQNITDGEHTISIQARDGWGNFSQLAAITVSVSEQTLAVENSAVNIDKTTILNNGLDPATITVIIKDQNNQPIPDWAIEVESSFGLIITIPNNNSDLNGQIVFEVRSTSLGAKTVAVKVDNQILQTLSLNVTSPALAGTDFVSGDLIKASTAAVYYFANDGKRYVFPNASTYFTWYDDFSGVISITDDQLASIPIGGNVTYKPGIKMVKITTDPKVYTVAANGTLHWIETEELAIAFYGENWTSLIEDVPDAFFTNYQIGEPISLLSDYSPLDAAQTAESINIDKSIII